MKVILNFLLLLWETLPFLHKTLWFNIKYLPWSQAKKLPVLFLSKSTVGFSGQCIIQANDIRFGMIKIGQNFHTNRPNTGIFFNIKKGGILLFKGTANIGYNTSIEIGEHGILEIGNNFATSYGAVIYAYHKISIGDDCRIGWNTVLMDTSFHSLKKMSGEKTKGYAPISIGNNVWIPSFCRVMPGAIIPDYIVFGSGSFISKDYSDLPPRTLLAGTPLSVKKTGIFRDLNDDSINYE